MAVAGGAGLARAMGDESVVVYVGPERRRYLIHKALLTEQSDYFDRALNGSFKEANEQAIHLAEESPAAFDLLICWLYQNRIPIVGRPFGYFRDTDWNSAVEPPTKTRFGFPTNNDPRTFSPGGSLFGNRHHFTSGSPPIPAPASSAQAEMAWPSIAPKNEGTGDVPYQPHVEATFVAPPIFTGTVQTGNPPSEHYHHISSQPEYRNWSTQELRLADYKAGRLDCSGIKADEPSPFSTAASSAINPSERTGTATLNESFRTSGPIPGIPKCPSLDDILTTEEEHQLAVLQLCLLAEKLCWDNLFNRAMTTYVRGEANLSHRPIPSEHIELIYQRAHDESPCRDFAADAVVSRLSDHSVHAQYLELTKEYPAFLADIFKSLGNNPSLSLNDPTKKGKCSYHVHSLDGCCQGKEEARKEWLSTRFDSGTRSWMDWRERNLFSASSEDED